MPSNGMLNFETTTASVIDTNSHVLSNNGIESGCSGSEDECLSSSCSSPSVAIKFRPISTMDLDNKSPLKITTEDNNNNNCSNAKIDDRYMSLPNREKHEKFLRKFIDEVINLAVFDGTDRKNKVLDWKSPEEMLSILDLNLKEDPDSDDKLMELMRNTIKYSVKTGHPYFVNQLFSAVDAYALAGQWLTDALNPSVYTYEVAPVFILMEEIVLSEMRKIVGWKDGQGDGIFCPGGSMANGYAIACARYKFMPNIKVNKIYR